MTPADEAWAKFEEAHAEALKLNARYEGIEDEIIKIGEERKALVGQDRHELIWCLNELRIYIGSFEFRQPFETAEGEIKAERIKRRLLEELNDLTTYVSNWN